MNAGRPTYQHVWDNFVPAALDAQIKLITAEIAIHQAIWRGKLNRGQIHEAIYHEHMHTLRSVLHTLRQLQDAAGSSTPAAPGTAQETQEPTAP